MLGIQTGYCFVEEVKNEARGGVAVRHGAHVRLDGAVEWEDDERRWDLCTIDSQWVERKGSEI